MLFTCTLPGRARSKKNGKQLLKNKRTGKMFIASSNEFKRWSTHMGIFVRRAKTNDTINFPCALKIEAQFTNYKHSQDADNLASSIMDLLQDNEIIKNDTLFYVVEIRKIYESEKDQIKIEIKNLVD